jgi:hypothetical protein
LAFVTSVTGVAVPSLLVPPNGQFMPVVVSGQITSTGAEAPRAFFQVTDEYRRDEPRGHLTLVKTAPSTYSYSFQIFLQAQRSTRVPDGRHYYILVAAGDQDSGNGATIPVLVPKGPVNPQISIARRPAAVFVRRGRR